MTTEELKTFRVTIDMRATCRSDAEELLIDYTGAETDLAIVDVQEMED